MDWMEGPGCSPNGTTVGSGWPFLSSSKEVEPRLTLLLGGDGLVRVLSWYCSIGDWVGYSYVLLDMYPMLNGLATASEACETGLRAVLTSIWAAGFSSKGSEVPGTKPFETI